MLIAKVKKRVARKPNTTQMAQKHHRHVNVADVMDVNWCSGLVLNRTFISSSLDRPDRVTGVWRHRTSFSSPGCLPVRLLACVYGLGTLGAKPHPVAAIDANRLVLLSRLLFFVLLPLLLVQLWLLSEKSFVSLIRICPEALLLEPKSLSSFQLLVLPKGSCVCMKERRCTFWADDDLCISIA